MVATPRLLRDLASQVDSPHVYSRPADLAAYAFDAFGASGDRFPPDAVVFPKSTAEVAGVLQVCAHHGAAVIPRGAGTGTAGGAVAVTGGVILALTRMNRILTVDPGSMRIAAEAGTVTAAIQGRALDSGLYYPPDPASATTCTIGGNVACNAGGPHTLRYGVTADYVTGLTAVLADGRTLRMGEGGEEGGGLLELLIASEGTIAVVTEVRLRLIPAPATRATTAAYFAGMERAAAAVAEIAAAGLIPAALEFMDRHALDAVARTGLAGVDREAGAMVIVEVEGDIATTGSEAAAVRDALTRAGAERVEQAEDPRDAARLWAIRRAVSAAVAKVMVGSLNADIVVPRDRIATLIRDTQLIAARHGLPVVNFGHLGDGNLHTSFLIDPRLPGERARADAAVAELFGMVLAMGGSLTGEHGIGYCKLPWLERQLGTGTIELMHRIKDGFDPRGILNPGKKVPALATRVPGGEPRGE